MMDARTRTLSYSGHPHRILIFRLGSLGDTIVAMPALRVVQRAFPNAERAILTTETTPDGGAMGTLLEASGIAERFILYKRGERRLGSLLRLRRAIRAFAPDLLVYLAEPRGVLATWRDVLFFRLCGIPRIVGAPLTADLRRNRMDPETGLVEREAERLVRCVSGLGEGRLHDLADWSPVLTPEETRRADEHLAGWPGSGDFMVASVSARESVRDWGGDRWAQLLRRLGATHPSLGLVLLGGPADLARAREVAPHWPGSILVLCQPDLRLAIGVLRRARLFVGVDSGPMHLAAALGVPTVAAFAGNNPFGKWFPPTGPEHAQLYHRTPCTGCGLSECVEHGTACLRSVTVEAFLAACLAALARSGGPR